MLNVKGEIPPGGWEGGTCSIHDGEVQGIFWGWKFATSVFSWVKGFVSFFFFFRLKSI